MSPVLLMSMRMVAVMMFMKQKIPSMHGIRVMPAISDSLSLLLARCNARRYELTYTPLFANDITIFKLSISIFSRSYNFSEMVLRLIQFVRVNVGR
jgi:Na+-transporting NADH:ubiquinone oxidoreductase subunit NqrE